MSSCALRHDAFVYGSDRQFTDHGAPFIAEGLAEGATAIAVTTRRNWASLCAELGPEASARVSFTDRDAFYVRPVDAIAAYEAALRRDLAGGAPSVRVLAEVQFGPTPQEWQEWTAYEAIANRAFAAHPAWLSCAYDERALPGPVVAAAWHTHPHVTSGEAHPSPHFGDPAELVAALAGEPRRAPGLRALTPSGPPARIRERLGTELAVARVPEAQALDLLIAANEIVINAWEHAGGPTGLRAGPVAGRFVVEVCDEGPGLDDPLAGYLPPRPGQERGLGLWVARQLVSRLELLPREPGLTARLWL